MEDFGRVEGLYCVCNFDCLFIGKAWRNYGDKTKGRAAVTDGIFDISSSSEFVATSTFVYDYVASSTEFELSNGNMIYNLVGGVGEWTDQTITKASLITPVKDDWMEYYNNERTHQGKMCCGRTPIETLEDGKEIWQEKLVA